MKDNIKLIIYTTLVLFVVFASISKIIETKVNENKQREYEHNLIVSVSKPDVFY